MKESIGFKKRKKYILFATFLAIGLIVTISTVSYAQELRNLSVTASVKPHYEVKADGNNLYIQTNMKVFINGKEVQASNFTESFLR